MRRIIRIGRDAKGTLYDVNKLRDVAAVYIVVIDIVLRRAVRYAVAHIAPDRLPFDEMHPEVWYFRNGIHCLPVYPVHGDFKACIDTAVFIALTGTIGKCCEIIDCTEVSHCRTGH